MCVQATAGACGAVLLTDTGSLGGATLAGPLHAAVAAGARGVSRPVLVLIADAAAESPAEALAGGAAANCLARGWASDRASGRALAQAPHRSRTSSSSSGRGGGSSSDALHLAIRAVGIAGQAGLSEPALLQGLAWLAQQAPPQPRLWVGPCLPRPECPRALPLCTVQPATPPTCCSVSQHACATPGNPPDATPHMRLPGTIASAPLDLD